MAYYKGFKLNVVRETYLSSIYNVQYRSLVTRFRLSCLNLFCDLFRQTKNVKYVTSCPACLCHVVEDEFHVLMVCSVYRDLRKDLLEDPLPNIFNFNKIMTGGIGGDMATLGRFLSIALERRRRIMLTN